MRRFTRLLLCLVTAVAPVSWAGASSALELSLNGDAVQFVYENTFRDEWAKWDVGWLHHEDNGNAYGAGLHVSGPVGKSPALRAARLYLGGKIVYFSRSGEHGVAIAPGGRFVFPFAVSERLYAAGYLHFAPGILTFADGDSYRELGGELGFRIIPRFELYLGLRDVKGDFEDGPDASLDDGLHFGLRGRF